MKTYKTKILTVVLIIFTVMALTNCKAVKNANNKQKGAVIGTTGGAVLGAILGNNLGKGGNGELGAVIGGVVGGAAGVIIGNKMDKQAKEIEQEVPGAEVERIDDDIIVTFEDGSGSGVHFATNKYDLDTDSRNTLNKLIDVFKEYPDTNILIVGHTDSTGDADYNMTLSKNRAYAVTNYLDGNGISKGRLNTNWFGETKPLHDNSTSTGRAKNRRVNVVIIPNDKMIEEAKREIGQ